MPQAPPYLPLSLPPASSTLQCPSRMREEPPFQGTGGLECWIKAALLGRNKASHAWPFWAPVSSPDSPLESGQPGDKLLCA